MNANHQKALFWLAGINASRGNDDDAIRLYERALARPPLHMGALVNLGLLYAAGRGVPQDNVEALKWIELSVYSLPPGGPRSDAARALKDVADKMTADQSMEAKGRARTWRANPATK
jgi:TPR repeat protein